MVLIFLTALVFLGFLEGWFDKEGDTVGEAEVIIDEDGVVVGVLEGIVDTVGVVVTGVEIGLFGFGSKSYEKLSHSLSLNTHPFSAAEL